MSRRADYIPRSDGDFNVWLKNVCERISATPAAYGVLPDELAELQTVYAAWQTDYRAHVADQNKAHGSTEVKDASRDEAESVGRRLSKLIQSRKGTTDAQRQELGFTVQDTTRTPLAEQIVLTEPPPVIKAKCTESKTVRIDWYPSQAEGQSEALPMGIDGVAIWVAEGGIPGDKQQWRFLALDTNSPYVHNVRNDATITLAYKAQWFDRRKRMGPFCSPVVVAVTP